MEKLFTYQEAGKIQLSEYGQLLSEEYTDTGILVRKGSAAGNLWEAYVTQPDQWNWQKYGFIKLSHLRIISKYNDMSVKRSFEVF